MFGDTLPAFENGFRTSWLERRTVRVLFGAYSALIACVYLATLGRGLWEDGYFAWRFAYNFWKHGSFAWNVGDGPIYGMTSQTLQLLAALIYRVAPAHFVLALKFVLFAALPLTLWALERSAALDPRGRRRVGPVAERRAIGAALVGLVGLSCPLVAEVTLSGLETPLALVAVSCCCWAHARFVRGESPWPLVFAMLGTYLTRPDALLVPSALLLELWWRRRSSASRRARSAAEVVKVAAYVALGLGALLACFRLYYGSALPLPFYVKVQGLSAQTADHLAIFQPEKRTNAAAFVFFAAPFVFVALHSRRREVRALLISALVFGGYHYFATIETMGQCSRFYLPGLVPVVAAAALAYRDYLRQRRLVLTALGFGGYVVVYALSRATFVLLPPAAVVAELAAVGVVLFARPRAVAPLALAAAGALLLGTYVAYPLNTLQFETDETILLRQIRPRMAFRELERVVDELHPRVLFHTDMGAPGVLLPESRVVDIDGLLNPDILLRHHSVEELCRRERPDVFYVPNHTYPTLRAALLAGKCIRGYTRVVPLDGYTALHVRTDELSRYGAFDAQ